MSIFHGAQNTTISGGNFTTINSANNNGQWEREKHAMHTLEQHVAVGASYDSKERHDAPKCLPRTREAVLREIADWIHVTSAEKPILWLYGPAGAGKSAISQSVAEMAWGYLLVATFFFARSNGVRNNAEHLIPSLAYQMIQSVPCTRHYVLNTIFENPQVFSRNLKTQMTKLIVEPLLLAGVQKTPPLLIIVDGLDECQDSDDRTQFIQAFAENYKDPSFPLIFLCHSRPESDIRAAFNDPETAQISARVVLNSQFDPDADIRLYLDHHFLEIKRTHPSRHLIPDSWPSRMAVEKLVTKSSGQFIYASTVVKHVGSRKFNPTERLEVVLNVGSGSDASPFKELDALYQLVLSSVDDHLLDKLVRVIGMICCPSKPHGLPTTPAIIDEVLNLSKVGGTLLLLDDLHSLIEVDGPTDHLRPFHASFGDFLSDKARSEKYYVDPGVPIGDHVLAYFKVMLYASTIHKKVKVFMSLDLVSECTLASLASLTTELVEFFEEFPWALFLQKALPRGILSRSPTIRQLYHYEIARHHDDGRHVDWPWLWDVKELYQFGKNASELSLTMATEDRQKWAAIYQRVPLEIAAYIVSDLNLVLSSVGPAFTRMIQFRIRELFVHRLLDLDHFEMEDDEWDQLDRILLDVLQTPGLSLAYHIDREQRNSAIFDTILQMVVMCQVPLCLDMFCHYDYRYECLDFWDFEKLLDLSDRTPYLDTILPYLKDIPANLLDLSDRIPYPSDPGGKGGPNERRNVQRLKNAIIRYQEKPISNGYDYSFQSNFDIASLREKCDVINCLYTTRGGYCYCEREEYGKEMDGHIEFLQRKYPGIEPVLKKCVSTPSLEKGDRTLSLTSAATSLSILCDIIPFRFNIFETDI